jgi:SAM-dependent methyltransferase
MNTRPADAARDLPADFLDGLERLAAAYRASDDPILQSGFGGGPERWRTERAPILAAVDRGGSFLDVGCANGFLLECLVAWASARGHALVPFGLDASAELIALARRRLPAFAAHLFVGNAWDWRPPRRFGYVYALSDLVPATHLGALLRRMHQDLLEPGGRLVVGSYGSRSRRIPPLELVPLLASFGLAVAGTAAGGEDGIARFAWVEGAGS